MKPVIKYQGGKTRELKTINTMLPRYYERVVEPFCGGAALSFSLGKPAVLTDINHQVINLYRVIADDSLYPKLQEVVDLYKTYDHDKLSPIYYDARSVINQNNEDNIDNNQNQQKNTDSSSQTHDLLVTATNLTKNYKFVI